MTNENVSRAEIDKFAALANRWWDENGPQKPLHHLNPARLGYVVKQLPLRGRKVLDVGCGGGLLSEAMAREGAEVVALDLAAELIEIAKLHLYESNVKVDYRLQSVESLAEEMTGQFDAITCMEMLEHVPDPSSILRACEKLLKPGGKLFISTLNRTPAAFAIAIVGAEYLANLLPKGTHEYQKFIKPSELASWCRAEGFNVQDISGLAYNPMSGKAWVNDRTDINYLMTLEKP
ncbi:MAG TPA: bifunctional 2-polyprenyl-6-hydroxyphenol methylase/3-demethylubiquinol 3-O-methyltransferase UbiG [Arenimonas sp.]|nr:bifunctional 2-polyprenyl-6-hydroxyphenol methylase/3-demethylubiquinol 3-O-methyltransferase UbiG [Arenimonas sp.]HPO24932.1 bifunctional 2-polyprenyl-6-hydroxyphenol methylase/3-demethylubiquinol 3-O-methyltransferase UbiG [Arenimonas sp.]